MATKVRARIIRAHAPGASCSWRVAPIYTDLSALECSAIFPPAAPAGPAQVEKAAGSLHTEEHAAESGCSLSAGRSDAPEISAGDSRHRSARRQADSDLHRKNRTRTARRT